MFQNHVRNKWHLKMLNYDTLQYFCKFVTCCKLKNHISNSTFAGRVSNSTNHQSQFKNNSWWCVSTRHFKNERCKNLHGKKEGHVVLVHVSHQSCFMSQCCREGFPKEWQPLLSFFICIVPVFHTRGNAERFYFFS